MLLSTSRAAISSLLHPSFPKLKLSPFLHLKTRRLFTETPTPLLYDCIRYRPVRPSNPPRHRSKQPSSSSDDADSSPPSPTDRSKRKYYRKRAKRMYGSSSDAESDADFSRRDSDLVELKPEIVEFRTQHLHEQELYFHDVFAFPWEKQKHYRMMYELEKKYFPDQCLDKAFLDPNAEPPAPPVKKGKKRTTKGKEKEEEEEAERDESALVFFEDAPVVAKDGGKKGDVKEKKVEEFFKCLKKSPSGGRGGERSVVAGGNEVVGAEPFLVSRRTEMPPRWDGPAGTVVLVDKPKGWTSFTVCGKLRRLVKVQKVGHAGTLDPMATGLLIVCIGKATKVVDRYQGMVKSYSGVFRLGEATSTWDADSPVIQREPWEHIKDDDMKKTAASFLGEIWQVPPMFSAIKVGGEKMYDKARRGEMIELSPRRISIFQFDIERSLDDRQNLIFRVTCSKGTYIRSLCADFGKALGSCAHLTALRRDSIGEYAADDAWSFQELEEAITKGYF